MSEKKDYFDYVVNVLGVKSIMLNPLQTSAAEIQNIPLLICVEDFAGYTHEETELLGKMVSALNLDMKLIKVIDLIEIEKFRSEFTVYFLNQIPKVDPKSNTINTYSSRALLKNSEYKKIAWNELQKVIAYFKTRP